VVAHVYDKYRRNSQIESTDVPSLQEHLDLQSPNVVPVHESTTTTLAPVKRAGGGKGEDFLED